VVLPCAVSSASRAGAPIVVVGVATVDVDVDAGVLMLRFFRRSSSGCGG